MAYATEFIETIVVSTRIRLARNFAAYPFPKKMDSAQAEDIAYLVGAGLEKFDKFTRYDISSLSKQQAALLLEQRLISPALLKSKGGVAFVSFDNAISIMVNEEDHLRQQYIYKGFDLYKAYERISGIDEGLGALYDFAFDKKLGFITACPSNLGTGMRASVMMFLPGLSHSGELKEYLPALKRGGMTVRGAFGEGTSSEGYMYQISNERTLGMSEREILDEMIRVTMTLSDLELRAREEMMRTSETEIRDRCLRAYGTLTNCAVLPLDEFTKKMADVHAGTVLGILETLDDKGFEDFCRGMRPAAFRIENGLEKASERRCAEARAETVCNVLPELVRVVRKNK